MMQPFKPAIIYLLCIASIHASAQLHYSSRSQPVNLLLLILLLHVNNVFRPASQRSSCTALSTTHFANRTTHRCNRLGPSSTPTTATTRHSAISNSVLRGVVPSSSADAVVLPPSPPPACGQPDSRTAGQPAGGQIPQQRQHGPKRAAEKREWGWLGRYKWRHPLVSRRSCRRSPHPASACRGGASQ